MGISSLDQNFLSVPIDILMMQDRSEFDLYTKVNNKYVLFASKDTVIDIDQASKVKTNNVERVFLHKKDEDVYKNYLVAIVDNEDLIREEKARALYESAKNAMVNLFDNPDTPESINAVKDVSDNIIESLMSDEKAFSAMVKMSSYDYYTYTHSVNVAVYAIGLGKKLGLNPQELKNLGYGAALHDIGKSKIPSEIINKNGKLTDEEFDTIRMHPPLGEEHLLGLGELNRDILDVVNFHHEKMNGSGYPNKLRGEDIPLFARIVSIVDIFDALNSKRSYKEAMTSFETLQFMKLNMSEHIDTKLLGRFILCMSGK
jgi:HD-GYP domain-containing protein (c-di-GMP phosphodiesterase class II)